MDEAEYEAKRDAIMREEVAAMYDRLGARLAQLIVEKCAGDFVAQQIKEHPEWRTH